MLSIDATELAKYNEGGSSNYDDSGYFSVQVIHKALEIMGLDLIVLGSESERQTRPESQLAFICNLNSHWFTLRRFGDSSHRWYNLNSTLSEPEYVSETYLSLLITQFQNEGYSVFIIRGRIPECEADMQAKLMPVPTREAMQAKPKPVLSKKRNSDYDEDFEKAMAMSLGKEYTGDSAGEDVDDGMDDETRRAIEASMSEFDHCDKTLNAVLKKSMQESGGFEDHSFKPVAVNQLNAWNPPGASIVAPKSIPEKVVIVELSAEEIRAKRMKMFEKKD